MNRNKHLQNLRREQQIIKRYKRALGVAVAALESYADPQYYHAIAFWADRPAGGFADDFSEDHGSDYERPMPGKLARDTMERLRQEHGDLGYIEDGTT